MKKVDNLIIVLIAAIIGIILVSLLMIHTVEDSKYNYPAQNGLSDDEYKCLKSGFREGYNDAIQGNEKQMMPIGCCLGCGYELGWKSVHNISQNDNKGGN